MGKRIVYTRPDGSLSVVVPAANGRLPDETEVDWLARVAARSVPAEVPSKIVDVAAIPRDRTFRDAWVDAGEAVAVDMVRARAIHLDRIRQMRNKVLDALDREWTQAMGWKDNEAADEVEKKRRLLRDVPQVVHLERFATPEALAAFWPEGLPRGE